MSNVIGKLNSRTLYGQPYTFRQSD